MRSAVIVDVVRTPSGRGKAGGALSGEHPAELLALVIEALVNRSQLDPALIDDVIVGCVTQAGDQAANIARTAALAAGLPESVPGTTVDRQCGSSQQAATFAAQGIIAGSADIIVAGGVESMSRVPMFSAVAGGDPLGPLARRYPNGLPPQGYGAEMIAAQWDLSRERLDEFAARSHALADEATRTGAFENEIVPVRLSSDGAQDPLTTDQTIRPGTTAEGLSSLDPAFYRADMAEKYPEIQWRITAGNASPLTDGASAALIMSEERARELGLKPRARFHSFAVTGSDPVKMLTGVIPATQKILTRSGLSLGDIDAFEVNEAFASVPLAWAEELEVDVDRVNPRGGAIALGHPLGASGGRLLATLLNHLEDTGGRFGLQTMCEGGGMANATIIERL